MKNNQDLSQKYLIDTNKIFKVWFSNNPNVFLNIENQLRLSNLRNNNPSAQITLVYSASLLSSESLQKMEAFCAENKIISLDINSADVTSYLDTQYEQKLHALANDELNKWILHEGGNPAAASDMVRLIKIIIDRCGIYTDFDVHTNFEQISQKDDTDAKQSNKHHPCWYPISNPIITSSNLDMISNDLFGAAVGKETGQLHDQAIQEIEKIQKMIIETYEAFKNSEGIKQILYLKKNCQNLVELIQLCGYDDESNRKRKNLILEMKKTHLAFESHPSIHSLDQLASIIHKSNPYFKAIATQVMQEYYMEQGDVKSVYGYRNFINNKYHTAQFYPMLYQDTVISVTGCVDRYFMQNALRNGVSLTDEVSKTSLETNNLNEYFTRISVGKKTDRSWFEKAPIHGRDHFAGRGR
jgi:hypothetical protein